MTYRHPMRTITLWRTLQLMFGAWLGGVFVQGCVTAAVAGAVTLAVLWGAAAVVAALTLVVTLYFVFRHRPDPLNPYLES